jgi:hypothetical protein
MPTRQGELRQIPFSLTPSSLGICPAYHLCKNINLLTEMFGKYTKMFGKYEDQ